jgi:hypothetical protein
MPSHCKRFRYLGGPGICTIANHDRQFDAQVRAILSIQSKVEPTIELPTSMKESPMQVMWNDMPTFGWRKYPEENLG